MRRDEDRDEDRFEQRRRCPYCGSHFPPVRREKVGAVGWVLLGISLGLGVLSVFAGCGFPPCFFGVVFVFAAPLFLLVKETFRECAECAERM